MLDHAVGVFVLAAGADPLRLDVRAEVHPRGVPPAEERGARLHLPLDVVLGRGERLLVDRLHPLAGERAGVLDRLAALAVGPALEHAPRPVGLAERLAVGELHAAGVVAVLRLLLGVQVVEVAEELVEAVHRRQVLVAVALVVLAELARGVAQALEHRGDRDVRLLPAFLRAGQADLGHAGADRAVAAEERGPPRRAALLAVVIGEGDPLACDPVDVGRAVAHHATAVVADVPGADVVAPDHEDIGPIGRHGRGGGEGENDADGGTGETTHGGRDPGGDRGEGPPASEAGYAGSRGSGKSRHRPRFRAVRWRGRPVPTAPPSPASRGRRGAVRPCGGSGSSGRWRGRRDRAGRSGPRLP